MASGGDGETDDASRARQWVRQGRARWAPAQQVGARGAAVRAAAQTPRWCRCARRHRGLSVVAPAARLVASARARCVCWWTLHCRHPCLPREVPPVAARGGSLTEGGYPRGGAPTKRWEAPPRPLACSRRPSKGLRQRWRRRLAGCVSQTRATEHPSFSGSCPHSRRGIAPSESQAQDAERNTGETTRTPG